MNAKRRCATKIFKIKNKIKKTVAKDVSRKGTVNRSNRYPKNASHRQTFTRLHRSASTCIHRRDHTRRLLDELKLVVSVDDLKVV